MVVTVKSCVVSGLTPVMNIWWPQTMKLSTAAAIIDIVTYFAP